MWDGGGRLTKKVCVQLFKAISGEKAYENHADYSHVALTTSLVVCLCANKPIHKM